MKGNKISKQNKNYLILLFIIIIFESVVIIYSGFQYHTIKSTNDANVSVSLKLFFSSNMVSNVNLTLLSKDKNLTLSLLVHQSELTNGTPTKQNLTPNTTQKPITTIPHRTNLIRNITFTGLQPYTNYNIKLVGIAKPHCYVGYMCPMYVLNINKSINLITGKQGSIYTIPIRLS